MQGQMRGTWKLAAAMLTLAGIGLFGLTGCPGGKPVRKRDRAKKEKKAKKTALDVANFSTADADGCMSARPADVFASKVYNEIIGGLKEAKLLQEEKTLEQMIADESGLDVSQIAQVNVLASADREKFAMIALFKSPYDRDAVVRTIEEEDEGKLTKAATHEGFDLLSTGKMTEDGDAIAFLTPTLVALGELETLKSALTSLKAGKNAAPAAKELMDSAPEGASVVIALPSLAKAAPALQGTPIQGIDPSQAKDMVLAITAGDNLEIWARVNAVDADTAAKLRAEGQSGLEQLSSQPNPFLDNPKMAPLKEALGSVKIGGTGTAIEITATIKPDIVKIIPTLQEMFGAMMMQGLGGGAPGGGDLDFDADFE